jgi:hypothetical protein
MLFTVAIALAALGQPAAQTSPQSGSLAGCISDAGKQRLPGVSIVAQSAGVRRTGEADSTGCYELKDLKPGPYRLIARLRGFDSITRDGVTITAGTVTRLDWLMAISPMCECVRIGGTLLQRVQYAEAVLHVRIVEPDLGRPQPNGVYRHSAQVLNVLKRSDGVRAATVSFLQNQSGRSQDPYDVGQELVVFLQSSRGDPFTIINDNPGLVIDDADRPAMSFQIRDGRIQNAPSDLPQYVGMRLDAFLNELRSVSRKK